ncbi:MAG: MFS transporter, partial [Bacteroidota bacterium]|nr:MFS transporter [Bacteroidota bacterium]MDX5429969.1 MFS transporter [Bacteroidota bacterium]MDX5468742.1 MFS transporter [Bacteroidota bacterium]
MQAFAKNNKRIMNSWAIYDMANSVYSLCIATAIFPPYYENLTSIRNTFDDSVSRDLVSFFGFQLKNSVVYEYGLSIAFLTIAFLSPILSGIADYTGNKKGFMKFFVYLGALSCVGLFFFDKTFYRYELMMDPNFAPDVTMPILCFILATIGFSGSFVFYNSYLPEICTPDRFEKLSARGFAMGYAGSVVLLIINLLMIQMPHLFGIPDGGTAARISFLTVGIWWAGIAQITFFNLPSTTHKQKISRKLLFNGFKEIKRVFYDLKVQPKLRGFLVAFFFLSMGLQTVMFVASLFGKKVLNMPTPKLIITVLLIQLIAIPGSYLFAYGANKKGNIPVLGLSTLVWIGVCVAAYFTTEHYQFYIIAAVVGFVMGGVQSLCRATFTRILNREHDTAS